MINLSFFIRGSVQNSWKYFIVLVLKADTLKKKQNWSQQNVEIYSGIQVSATLNIQCTWGFKKREYQTVNQFKQIRIRVISMWHLKPMSILLLFSFCRCKDFKTLSLWYFRGIFIDSVLPLFDPWWYTSHTSASIWSCH